MDLEHTAPGVDPAAFDVTLEGVTAKTNEQEQTATESGHEPESTPPESLETSFLELNDQERLELMTLERQIAMNPAARQQYEAALGGQGYIPQPVQPPQQWQAPQQQAPIESMNGTDEYTQELQKALFPLIQPLYGYVEEARQAEQRYQAEQRQQVFAQQVQAADAYMLDTLDKVLPGFKDAFSGTGGGLQQEIFQTYVDAAFRQAVNGRAPEMVLHPLVQKDILGKMLPQIKQAAATLGLQFGKPSEKAQTAKQETYVEPSGAVPTESKSQFDVAYKRGDTLGMAKALLRGK